MTCKYKVKIKDIQYNYKVQMTDIQSKYKFKVFCTGYDDSEIKEKIDTMYEAWPKASGEGETFTLDNTIQAPIKVNLKGNTYQKTTTGKNMFDISKVITSNRVVNNGDGTLTITTPSGSSASSASTPNKLSDYCPTLQVGDTVYINATTAGTDKQIYLGTSSFFWQFGTQRTITQNDLDSIVYWYASGISTTATISDIMISTSGGDYEPYTNGASPNPDFPQDIHVVSGENTIMIANEDSSESQNYTIDLGDIELCKIGDYQDYFYKDNGKWYLHKEIGKVVYDGSGDEDWRYSQSNAPYRISINNIDDIKSSTVPILYCNYYIPVSWSDTWTNYEYLVSGYIKNIAFRNINITSLEDWKSWLGTHNTIVYYVLATPTYTEITDTTLLSQLEALKEAESYSGQTNISQTNDDKPFILTVKALKDLSNL